MTSNESYTQTPTLWDWLTGQGDPVLATSRLIVVLSSLVIISAGVLGFTALRDLFVSIGLFHPILGYLFPILFDAAEVTFAVSTLNAQLQGEEDRQAWMMVVVFTLLGMMANMAHAYFAGISGLITPEQTLLALIFTSLFPLSVALVTHNLKKSIKRQINRNIMVKSLADLFVEIEQGKLYLEEMAAQHMHLEAERSALEEQTTQLTQEIAALKKEKREVKRGTRRSDEKGYTEPTPETERQAYDYLAEQVQLGKRNKEINGAELGREIGTSESFGRRLKKRLLPEVRTDLGIPEPTAHPNGTRVTNGRPANDD